MGRHCLLRLESDTELSFPLGTGSSEAGYCMPVLPTLLRSSQPLLQVTTASAVPPTAIRQASAVTVNIMGCKGWQF